ncbi:LysR family transcriptional regulator [uncultured Azohydromonas sp.]|jgi:Transcriptional regulator|uniref:LysR family transcriptional regulator n=1 Tax=uncultured Azohydromonas sp. TaxID=487342 RepID=UPI0026091E86|nr:LysR family transcriptional regulator [uncultured Azohydromonas sp.]
MVKKALLGQVSDTEIRLLRIFKAVVECGGLAAAELELNIGRSTVSRHVKDLEERLGLLLCRRGRAGFALTADGQRVYEGALRLLEALDSFRTDVRDLHAELVGTLSLGLFDKTVTNPQARIGQAIRDFRRLAPAVLLDVKGGTLNEIESGVMDGRLQVGIVPDHRRSDSLAYIELFGETMYLYCGRQHPLFGTRHQDLGWKELQDHDYVGLAFHSPNMEATHRFRLRRQATVSDQEAVLTLILSGCYIGFLPDHYAASFVREGLIERVEHPECMYQLQFVAVLRRSPRPSRLSTTFVEALRRAHE